MHRITLRDVQRVELLGCPIEVVGAKNPALVGIKGLVQGETKASFVIRTQAVDRRVLKDQARFRILVEGLDVEIEGCLIAKRPEDRIKVK